MEISSQSPSRRGTLQRPPRGAPRDRFEQVPTGAEGKEAKAALGFEAEKMRNVSAGFHAFSSHHPSAAHYHPRNLIWAIISRNHCVGNRRFSRSAVREPDQHVSRTQEKILHHGSVRVQRQPPAAASHVRSSRLTLRPREEPRHV